MIAPMRSSLVQFSIFSALVLAGFSIGSNLWAQSSDEVHITPRRELPGRTGSAKRDADFATRPLRVEVNLVLVPVTVTDPMNRPVLTLQAQDFTLYEGQARQEIRYFSHEDAPISVGLVLDCSASMRNKIGYKYR